MDSDNSRKHEFFNFVKTNHQTTNAERRERERERERKQKMTNKQNYKFRLNSF